MLHVKNLADLNHPFCTILASLCGHHVSHIVLVSPSESRCANREVIRLLSLREVTPARTIVLEMLGCEQDGGIVVLTPFLTDFAHYKGVCDQRSDMRFVYQGLEKPTLLMQLQAWKDKLGSEFPSLTNVLTAFEECVDTSIFASQFLGNWLFPNRCVPIGRQDKTYYVYIEDPPI